MIRLLIELPQYQVFLLKQYCEEAQVSEAEAVKQAVTQFLARTAQKSHRTLRKHPAFGLWRDRQQNALAYQEDLRDEWSL
ncbi:CopG family transcriptional regulator [Candidatus Electronema sp. JC]|uniref:CopG family transcriptional regulator n=1 Tax=Candidatus Electronema sp. JC TaxID=3401570 RepID=UPI003AA9C1D6